MQKWLKAQQERASGRVLFLAEGRHHHLQSTNFAFQHFEQNQDLDTTFAFSVVQFIF
jgi:hypothetical protein